MSEHDKKVDESGINSEMVDRVGKMLNETLNIGDLIRGGAQFSLQKNFQDIDETDDLIENYVSPWTTPFRALIPNMFSIGNGIYKRIVKQSLDNIKIEGNCRVRIKYASYMENGNMAVDSNFLRGDTTEFIIWDVPIKHGMIGGVVAGLVYAVKSMKRGEESHFIIPYQLLYREMGCPPRIKPKSDLLYVIQLISFIQVGDENALVRVDDEDKHKYHVMIEKILAVKTSGIDYFKKKNFKKAAQLFHDAIHSLDMCETSNEEERKEKESHLIKLYTNIMICYNKMDAPKKVCSVFEDLRKFANTANEPKALYEHGKALMILGDYKGSRDFLRKASSLKPHDQCINGLLKQLDEKLNTYEATVSNLWRRALRNEEPFVPRNTSEVTENLKQIVSKLISDFEKSSNETKMYFPIGVSQSEIKAVKDLIKDKKMKLIETKANDLEGSKKYYLSKY